MGISQFHKLVEELEYNSKKVVFGEPWFVLGESGRRDPPAADWLDGEKVFSPELRTPLKKRKHRQAVEGGGRFGQASESISIEWRKGIEEF